MKKTLELASLLLMMAAATHAQAPGTGVNYNPTTPAPAVGTYNVTPQADSTRPTANISFQVTYPTLVTQCSTGGDLGTALLPVLSSLAASNGGIIDARACTRNSYWGSAIGIGTSNVTILLPCVQVSMPGYLYVAAGARNVRILGCTNFGDTGSGAGTGGTQLQHSGSGSAIIIGDPTYLTNTTGIEVGDLSIVMTGAASNAHAITIYDTQDLNIHDLIINGSGALTQIGIYLDGSGNYTGGKFDNIKIEGEGQAIWMNGDFHAGDSDAFPNASTFARLHIVCPTSAGSPIAGTYGIDLLGGDGNTFVGGDVEGCDTLLYLGAAATSNSFFGVRNENSNTQISAASGSQYNLWEQGGALSTGKVTDAGTHNSFIDTFHAGTNHLNGNLYRSQADSTVTNHFYTGIGLGNVRGLIDEYTTDVPGTPGSYQTVWQWGPGDGTAGAQVWTLQDMLNSVPRFAAAQFTTAGGNDQTLLNSAGSGGIVLNASANSGTGGVSIGSGGASPTTIWEMNASGNSYQLGNHTFYAGSTAAWYFECASISACNIESMNPTASAKHITLYNGGGTDFESEASAGVSVNSSSGGSTGPFTVYGGGASYYGTKLFQVQNNGNGTANYLFPSLAAASARACIDVDTSGYFHVLTYDCGSGSGTVTWPTAPGLQNWQTGSGWGPVYFNTPTSGLMNSATGPTTSDSYAGGQDSAAGSSTLGGATLRGANNTATTGAGTAGGAVVNGGNNASTTTSSQSGSVEIEPGTSTAGGQQGVAIYGQIYQEGSGSFTQWNLVCSDASTRQTADACGASPTNIIGVMDTHNGSYIEVHTPPSISPVNASAAVTLGHTVCAGATAGEVTDSSGTGPCSTGTTIGVVVAISGQYTFADGSSASISTTLPLVQLWKVHSVGAGDIVGTLTNPTTGNAGSATQLASSPTTCTAGNAPTGISANGNATGCAPLGTAVFSSGTSPLCTTSNCFMGVGYTGGSQLKGTFIAPRAGKMQNCSAAVGAATTGTNYYTATMWKNGSTCSGPTLTLNSGSYAVVTDNTDTCTVAQGDRITWDFVVTGTIPSADVGSASCLY